jgi:peptidoglycan-N-acetylglucosamine deacetylase
MTHPRMDLLSDDARHIEIDGMDAFLSEFDSRGVHPFRPPYGGVSASLFAYGLRHRRPVAMWSRDSLDYKYPPDRVVQGLEASPPRAGDILLFHDDGAAALPALQHLLPAWLKQGYTFATFEELALD